MDVYLVNDFVVVAQSENIESAATRLDMPITMLAERLSVLQNELGLVLFRQTPSGIELSAAGATFLPHARLIMAEVEAATQDIRQIVRLSERPRRWARLYRIFQDTTVA